MALPARRVPEFVAHLDVELIAAALISHDANVRNAARALGVPSGDLRKLVLVDQRLADAALEAVELRLDDAEANLSEALHCGDPRRRDASMFMLRNTQRASKEDMRSRPRRRVLRLGSWIGSRGRSLSAGAILARRSRTATTGGRRLSAMGKNIRVPRYDGARREMTLMASGRAGDDDRACRCGWSHPSTSRLLRMQRRRDRTPPSVTSASGLTPGSGTASSPIRSPPACSVASRSSRGRLGRKFRTARRERAFIGPVTPNGVLSGSGGAAGAGAREAEPFRTRRSRRMRGADVARVARSPPSAAVGRAFVRAICAAAAGCTTTPSTLMPKLIDHELNAKPSNKG